MEIISATNVELVIIGKYSHKEVIVNLITKTDLAETKNSFLTEDFDGNCFETSHPEKYIYVVSLIYSWYIGG